MQTAVHEIARRKLKQRYFAVVGDGRIFTYGSKNN